MRNIVLLALVGIVSAACLGSDFDDSVEGTWELTSGSVDGEPIPLIESHPITITFEEEDRVSGTASCNSYGGSFEMAGASITFDQLFMTEMACQPAETMTAERMYGDALARVDSVSIDGEMSLTGEGVELVFVSAEPEEG
jgi:heat shock protein HslJ